MSVDTDTSQPDTSTPPKCTASHKPHTDLINIDPDCQLPDSIKVEFGKMVHNFASVFSPSIPGYNGSCGPVKAVVNMGKVLPPQRKGKLPQYSRDKLSELQDKFDELEKLGVFRRPEDVNISVEYLNPSFLVKKPHGGYRLVTAFSDVGRYSKPQPSLLPDVDSTLRLIGSWKYIIVSDLSSAFYQIPLARESMKFCGVATPFKGVRVYTRSAMGMPGSETALEELMCRVLGDLLQEGIVAKIADDLFCGGNTPEELLRNWRLILEALDRCNLKLSPHKTTIAPKTTTILGWVWSQGSIHASPHKIAALATCDPPANVRGLRGFIGAYKVLGRVLPACSDLLRCLEDAVAGNESLDKVAWSDSLLSAFHSAQKALSSARSITIPKPSDQLWIVTDASVKCHGVGATLYVSRGDQTLLAGFFSAKLKKHQVKWLPCEVEALAIALAIRHFSPYLIQSALKPCVLTDSKPCVQAFNKLCRGEFSNSPRVATYLSSASQFQVDIKHLAGSANLPTDFASRNAAECFEPHCQVCSFIRDAEESVVRDISVRDILDGSARFPFTTRSSWIITQRECPDLRRVHAHLSQGTRPSRKLTDIKDVKRYLTNTSIAKDGLLVVRRDEPFAPTKEAIVVPRQVLPGLLTAIHLRLGHPSHHQMKSLCNRYFYALDLDKAIDQTSASCHMCTSLKNLPHSTIPQSTELPPEVVGVSFAADVMRRAGQCIFLLRESVTSYAITSIIKDEKHTSLRDAILLACVEMRPLDGPPATIRVDPAPGFVALMDDDLLQKQRIQLEVGRVKNVNKNPVAEHAIRELENEILRLEPGGASVSSVTLGLATATLNARLRKNGLSARESWTQRDQFSNTQIPVVDRDIIIAKHVNRLSNHSASEKAKAPKSNRRSTPTIKIGDLIYVKGDLNKSHARDRYLVTDIDPDWCYARKFIGTQLRPTAYRLRHSECLVVSCQIPDLSLLPTPNIENPDIEFDDDVYPPHTTSPNKEYPVSSHQPPTPPPILTMPIPAIGPSRYDHEYDVQLSPLSPSLDRNRVNKDNVHVQDSMEQEQSLPLGRPQRERRRPVYLNDYAI